LRKLLTDPLGKTRVRLEVNPFPEAYFVPWVEDMQPLPEKYGPSGSKWRNSFAVCAIMKDENITDVREWISYYKCVTHCQVAEQ
jgi:hypothetical protein